MAPKIVALYIIGPSSTGKTTICNALEKYWKEANAEIEVVHIKEVARDVMKEQGFTREDVATYAMQEAILLAQEKAESAGIFRLMKPSTPPAPDTQAQSSLKVKPKVLLSDRCCVDALVYTQKCLGEETRDDMVSSTGIARVLERYRGNDPFVDAKVFLTEPVKEWLVDDGVRSLDEPNTLYNQFRKLLKDLSIPFIQIDKELKSIEKRVEFVLGTVWPQSGLKSVPLDAKQNSVDMKSRSGALGGSRTQEFLDG